MNKSGGDNDTSTELLQDNEDNVELAGHHLVQEDRTKYTQSTRGQNDKEKADTETDVIVSPARLTC